MNIMSSDDIERAIGREQVREFVKDEIVKVLTDMTDVEIIKDALNNLYGVKMTDDVIKYCEADIAFVNDAYRMKEEQNMKMNKAAQSLISCIEHGDLHSNNVLFILFKDGRHIYYDLTDVRLKIGKESIGLYINNDLICYCRGKIAYKDIEDWAVGVKTLYITDSTGTRKAIPLTWVKEYVVDMPNDKKLVKERITVKKEELEDIIAKMRELEENIKKIKEG